ncbi:hypothetical protein CJ200_02075 [Citrobacter freundii]|nr:hypothetical protein CJ200_02075 [Citrobacter freundii]
MAKTIWASPAQDVAGFGLFNSGAQQELKSGERRVNSISEKLLICVAEPTGKHSRPREFCRSGGAAKNLPPQRANRRTHAPVFVGGLPRTPSGQAINLGEGRAQINCR